jgi:hypothetical protein
MAEIGSTEASSAEGAPIEEVFVGTLLVEIVGAGVGVALLPSAAPIAGSTAQRIHARALAVARQIAIVGFLCIYGAVFGLAREPLFFTTPLVRTRNLGTTYC